MRLTPIVNVSDVELSAHSHGESFEAQLGVMASKIGASQIGCRLTVVPPGKKAWPFRSHHANEEMYFVLEGSGTYRLGDDDYPIRQGDLVAAPAGRSARAHQVINSSEAPLKYLALSTMYHPDVMEYPDSNKFGVFAGSPPGGDKARRAFAILASRESGLDYWGGES